jgi:hypothetical protein
MPPTPPPTHTHKNTHARNTFSVSVSLGFPCMAHASFPECFSIHCQGLCRTFSEICTKFDAVPLLDPTWNRISDIYNFKKENVKKLPCPSSCVKFCTLTPNMLVLSHAGASHYNFCSDGTASPVNYGYRSYHSSQELFTHITIST